MEKNVKVDPKGHILLSREEMRNLKGGSPTETIVSLVLSASEYFFHMGIREVKKMKALL